MPGVELLNGRVYPHSFTADDLDELEIFVVGHDRTVTLAEVAAGDTDPETIAVRHDVDHDARHALRFAEWEAERGIRASYYLLPTADYYTDPNLPAIAQEIHGLGHEVGVHNDAFTDCGGHPDVALELLRRWADQIRSWGIPVTGCADHGGGMPRNVDLWRTHGRTPDEAGLAYEAYALHAQGAHYISDNRGTWRAERECVPGRQCHVLVHPVHWALP